MPVCPLLGALVSATSSDGGPSQQSNGPQPDDRLSRWLAKVAGRTNSRMRLLSRFTVLLSLLGCMAVGSVTPYVSARAFAAAPSPATVTPTAARHFGDGGPGLAALIHVGAATELADGTIVFYDRDAHTLRSVDPGTGVITSIAGTGAVPPAPPAAARCHIDTTSPATAVYVNGVSGMWSDTAGDLFIWTGGFCDGYGNVYRLA